MSLHPTYLGTPENEEALASNTPTFSFSEQLLHLLQGGKIESWNAGEAQTLHHRTKAYTENKTTSPHGGQTS